MNEEAKVAWFLFTLGAIVGALAASPLPLVVGWEKSLTVIAGALGSASALWRAPTVAAAATQAMKSAPSAVTASPGGRP